MGRGKIFSKKKDNAPDVFRAVVLFFSGRIFRKLRPAVLGSILFPLMLLPAGCTPVTYPEEKVIQALKDIASKEYGIPKIEVEFVGTTMGAYLPLDQLFSLDFKEAIMSGKVTDMESLFKPTDAAVDKVEDLLFSMSRVMLSTDKKIRFYFLQATDIEKSGMELSFLGNIEDVKRVRFWDIPRSEYRKRVIHDIRLNQAALWHQPARRFFNDLNTAEKDVIQTRYFQKTAEAKWAKEFLFTDPQGNVTATGQARWEILELRSIPVQDNDVVVYAKVRTAPKEGQIPSFSPRTVEYLFQISVRKGDGKIRRIIPLAYLDERPEGLSPSFTRETVYKSLPNWETEFKTPDIRMGDFLSRQLTRRLQAIVAEDERIGNTFLSVKPAFDYEAGNEPYFVFDAIASLRAAKEKPYSPDQGEVHEDVLYLWKLAAREFVEVLRSYEFRDYRNLEFLIDPMGESLSWRASREDLELFRRNKKDLKKILVPRSAIKDPGPDSGAGGVGGF